MFVSIISNKYLPSLLEDLQNWLLEKLKHVQCAGVVTLIEPPKIKGVKIKKGEMKLQAYIFMEIKDWIIL